MSREIKFRAWDKKTKKMRAVNSIAFHYEHEAFDYDNSRLPKVVNLWGTQIIGEYAPKEVIIHREIKQVELMQYTGLHDKNGKEIYEGDILKIYLNDASDEYLLGLDKETIKKGFIIKLVDDIFFFHTNSIGDYYEIIGNIYENPELIQNHE